MCLFPYLFRLYHNISLENKYLNLIEIMWSINKGFAGEYDTVSEMYFRLRDLEELKRLGHFLVLLKQPLESIRL